ncbi:hypothetical protein ACWEP4_38365 [Streptomyces sp. NPDC004227]
MTSRGAWPGRCTPTGIRGDEPGPAILNTPVPDLEALLLQVWEAFAAANAHIAECGTCRRDMRLPEMCADGQRLAVAAAATITEAVPAPAAPVVPAPEPVDRRLCPQNLVGDKAEPGERWRPPGGAGTSARQGLRELTHSVRR